MTGPSSTPRGEHARRNGTMWETRLVRVETVIPDDAEADDTVHACPGRWGGPQCRCFDDQPADAPDDDATTPRPNRATRRALNRKKNRPA